MVFCSVAWFLAGLCAGLCIGGIAGLYGGCTWGIVAVWAGRVKDDLGGGVGGLAILDDYAAEHEA